MGQETQDQKDVRSRLDAAEAALTAGSEMGKTPGSVLAKQYGYAIVHETVNPLEAINNLVYIAGQTLDDPESLRIYLELLEGQVERLNEVARRTLFFCKE